MDDYLNKVVVIDTSTKWVYIGILKEEDDTFFILQDVDAFDVSDTTLSKHEYVMMVKRDGLAPNRRRVAVLKSIVVSLTLLEDILTQ